VNRERETVLKSLAGKMGLEFQNLELFNESLTHSSYVNEREKGACRDNEALEFLGDAVLGLVVSHHLYSLFPSRPPGHYSALKADLVNQSALARCARELSLGECIRLGHGEELSNGRERDSVLANALEAVIGAVFLDGGLVSAREFVLGLIAPYLEERDRGRVRRDAKSSLQNLTQERFKRLPQYRVVSETGPDHKRHFEVELTINGKVHGTGAGRSKKAAEQNAAREALRKLEEESSAGFADGESCNGEEK
jgi:ribonuclease III